VSDDLGLIEGWRYSITTEKDPRSKGIFKGYAMIGNESSIVMQLSGGVTRYIPIARVIHIDLLGSAEIKRTEEKKPESAYYR
jgi:hypothetical protein